MGYEPAVDFSELIAEAEAYCAARGIKLATLGQYAVGNKHFFADRMAGRPCLTSTVDRIRRYMAEKTTGDAA